MENKKENQKTKSRMSKKVAKFTSRLLFLGFKWSFRLVEAVLPSLAGRWIIRLWFTPFGGKGVSGPNPVMEAAQREHFPFSRRHHTDRSGDHVVVYRWGEGPSVLLVHGWGGRASQWSGFVQPLLDAGFGVVAFDAPAHGDSPGKRSDVVEIAAVIESLHVAHGPFHGIISHSMGGLASALALSQRDLPEAFVAIAPPGSFAVFPRRFAEIFGVSARTLDHLVRHLESTFGDAEERFTFISPQYRDVAPGLIALDRQDREVDFRETFALTRHWPDTLVEVSEGLGHTRILGDPGIIATAVNYISNSRVPALQAQAGAIRHGVAGGR